MSQEAPFPLPNDNYGRVISYSYDAELDFDVYTVGSLGPPVPAFNVGFPSGTASSTVYTTINGIPPAGSGGLAAADPDQLVPANNNCGATIDRPSAPGMGVIYFDTDLGIPVWWVGHGETGWVDSQGDPV